MQKKAIQILPSLLGVVFLVSGVGKSLVAYEFSQILTQYGFDFLQYLAPVIIIFEIALGLMLFFGIRQKQVSLLALGFVAGLTLIFLYGHLFVNITDCGCFGHFKFLNTSPFFTYLRNVVLISALLYIFLNTDGSRQTADQSEMLIMLGILCAVCFTVGYTYAEPNNEATHYITKGKHVNVEVENTVLGEFLTPSKDSTYLVFVFSYACPHCYNSIENLKQYERMGVVDKVLALTFPADSATMSTFNNLFEPNFEIVNHSPKQLFRLTNRFPVSYYIEDNKIRMEVRGLLPCGYLFQQQLNKL